jgi:SAM-dependent methyltransferase
VSDWTDGYVSELDYTYGYYTELNPVRAALPLLNVGLAPPPVATACELGYGQGVSVNIHAAAEDTEWWGTDFNPAHAAFARSLAAASGADAHLYDQSFAEFAARSDLPQFDFIALHGTWSWVSPQNQQVIVDFIRRQLKVGGLLCISYNTQPGHAAMVPLRHLLVQHVANMAAPGLGLVARIDAAFEFTDKLMALNPAFATVNPQIAERLNRFKGLDRHYLAHELFNRDWSAMAFAELAQCLAPAKLSYACSARYLDHIDALNMSAQQHQFLSEISDPLFRQSVRDFVVNQQFRCDYWVKGAQRLPGINQIAALRRVRVLPAVPRSAIAMTVQGAAGQRELSPEIYAPILDQFDDHRPKSLGEIEAALSGAEVTLPALFEAVIVLAGKGDLLVVQDDEVQERVRKRTDRLNRRLLDRARSSGDVASLATPVTGGGVITGRSHQLFLLARSEGRERAEDLARFAWDLLSAQGQRVIKDGTTLETEEENLAELTREAGEFVDVRLPILKMLQIAA